MNYLYFWGAVLAFEQDFYRKIILEKEAEQNKNHLVNLKNCEKKERNLFQDVALLT